MKLNKLITILLLIFIVLSVFLYLENDKNKVSASKTIKIYQETNKKQEKEITELKLQIVKESKDHLNQISNEKIKNDSLLKEQTTKYDELLKHSLNQEQEVFLLEQKIKEIENKYNKMVCYEIKPKRQVETQQKYGQSMSKKVKKQEVVKNQLSQDSIKKETQVQNVIINNYVVPQKNKPMEQKSQILNKKTKLPKYYPVDGLK